MKNVMKAMVFASLMTPVCAHAVDAQTSQVLAQKMSSSLNANGVTVKMVDKKYVLDAINKMHGKVTVDLGSQGQVHVNNPQGGGVLIGSGSDGLAVVSNQSAGGPIVVEPPVESDTSITVVGRLGSDDSEDDGKQTNAVCAFKLVTDKQGIILPNSSNFNEGHCAEVGRPLRLEEGKFVILFNYSTMIIDLKKGEKKVIPLREILIAKQSDPSVSVHFDLLRNRTQAEELKNITILWALYFMQLDSDAPVAGDCTLLTPQQILDAELMGRRFSFPNRGGCPVGSNNDYNEKLIQGSIEYFSGSSEEVGSGKDGNFVSVLPGDYQIDWTIDGQKAPRTKLTVK